jgi:hypothetical protein
MEPIAETNPELRLVISREILASLIDAGPGTHAVRLDGETSSNVNPACLIGTVIGRNTGTFSAGGDCERHLVFIIDPAGPIEEIIAVADKGEHQHGDHKAPPHKAQER